MHRIPIAQFTYSKPTPEQPRGLLVAEQSCLEAAGHLPTGAGIPAQLEVLGQRYWVPYAIQPHLTVRDRSGEDVVARVWRPQGTVWAGLPDVHILND